MGNKIVITNILLTTMISGGAWAQNTYDITHGSHIWNNDMVINGVPGWPGTGIRGDGDIVGHFDINGNIDTSDNHSGVFISNGASVTFKSPDPTKTFSSHGNSWEGFLIESNAGLAIHGMNVSASGNKDNGIRADSGGSVYITDASKVEFNENGGRGIFSFNKDSVISISGKNDNSSMLTVNNNNPGSNWGAGIWSEQNALVSIKI